MMIKFVPPFLIYFISAILCTFLNLYFRRILILLTPILTFLYFLIIDSPIYYEFLKEIITVYRADSLNIPFFYAFLLISFIGFIFNYHRNERREHIFPLLYSGSAIGLIFANDFISLFFFWELLAIFSTFIIWLGLSKRSRDAGIRYLLIHLTGGVIFLVGIILLYKERGEFSFVSLKLNNLSSVLILIGVLINTATPPFSAWLSDAYPESSIGGTVFLSAFTTKSAVYVLCRFFAGEEILVYLGSIMAIYGVVYAFMVLDMRRLLSYHIISQVGFMVTGVGIGTHLALNGVISHAFTHIVYKGLLLMSVGAIYFSVGTERLNDLGGLLKKHRITFIFYSIGALSISGAPLLSGFVSKSITITSAQDAHNYFAWIMLNIASTGTFISVGLKLPYLAFFGEEKKDIYLKQLPLNMIVAMFIASFVCVFLGVYPDLLYSILPFKMDYKPYTIEHLIFVLQLFLGAFIVFVIYAKNIERKAFYIILDTDWFYRKVTNFLINLVFLMHNEISKIIENIFYKKILSKISLFMQNPLLATKIILEFIMIVLGFEKEEKEFKKIIQKYPADVVKHWPIGTTIMYTAVLLVFFLLVYYLS